MPAALVINPNTSSQMTGEIGETASQIFRPPWKMRLASAPAGPESLESWTDYYLATICLFPLLSDLTDIDGVILACFGDPGLYVLKELCPIPVVGIAEAAMSQALLLGGRFGILAGMGRAAALMDSMVLTYGLQARYAGAVSLNMRVLDFETEREKTLQRLIQASRTLQEQGAETLLLGCAGLTTYVQELQSTVEIPIIDPVAAGCHMLKSLVNAGLKTSHFGLFAQPAPQRMNHLERLFTPEMIEAINSFR